MQLRYILAEKFKGKVIRTLKKGGGQRRLCYYFNQDGVYSVINLKDARLVEEEKYFDVYTLENEKVWLKKTAEWDVWFVGLINYKLTVPMLKVAISRLELGDTLEIFDQYLSDEIMKKTRNNTTLGNLVTKIEKPVFERETGNNNKNVFDFIYVTVRMVQNCDENHVSYFKKHKKEIFKMVVEKLQADKQFQKFGVPVNFLKAQATVKKDFTIEFVFELKEQ